MNVDVHEPFRVLSAVPVFCRPRTTMVSFAVMAKGPVMVHVVPLVAIVQVPSWVVPFL